MKKILKVMTPLMILLSMGATSCSLPNFGGPNQSMPDISMPSVPNGQDGQDGKPGENGQDGTSLITGYGKPNDSNGKNGDSYIDLDTWDFYVRGEYGWMKKGNIKGKDGDNGNEFLTGYSEPGYYDGKDNDFYINLATNEIYHKENGSWNKIGSISGSNNNNGTQCTVKFDSGTTDYTYSDQTVNKGDKVSNPGTPYKKGYTFKGWTYDGEPWSFIGYVVTEDMTITAAWEQNTYKITYSELDDEREVKFGDNVYHPTMYREYATFLGWYYGDTKFENGTPYNYDYDIYLYPRFETYFPLEDYLRNIKANENSDFNPEIFEPDFPIDNLKMSNNRISFSATKENYENYLAKYKAYTGKAIGESATLLAQTTRKAQVYLEYDGSNIVLETYYDDGKTNTWPTNAIKSFFSEYNVSGINAEDLDMPIKSGFDYKASQNSGYVYIDVNKGLKNIYVSHLKKLGFKLLNGTENTYVKPDSSLRIIVSGGSYDTRFEFSLSDLELDSVNKVFRMYMGNSNISFPMPKGEITGLYFNSNNIDLVPKTNDIDLTIAEYENTILESGYKHFYDKDYDVTRFYYNNPEINFYLTNQTWYIQIYFSTAQSSARFDKETAGTDFNNFMSNAFGFKMALPDNNVNYIDISYSIHSDPYFSFSLHLKNYDEKYPEAMESSLVADGWKSFNGSYYKGAYEITITSSDGWNSYFKLRWHQYHENFTINKFITMIDEKYNFKLNGYDATFDGSTVSNFDCSRRHNNTRKSSLHFGILGNKDTNMQLLDKLFKENGFEGNALGYFNDNLKVIIDKKMDDRVNVTVSINYSNNKA